jgi:hypothetical protein
MSPPTSGGGTGTPIDQPVAAPEPEVDSRAEPTYAELLTEAKKAMRDLLEGRLVEYQVGNTRVTRNNLAPLWDLIEKLEAQAQKTSDQASYGRGIPRTYPRSGRW